MTAHPGVEVDDLRSASHVAADAAADASIVSEVSIASASATETRTHPARAANGRFVGRSPGVAPVDDEPDALQGDRFLDREISWLQFNERVLQLAADDNVPLLERARYLAIFASNLDEFFMVRVAGLKRRIATGIAVRSASGLEPREVLEQISLVAHELLSMQARVYGEQVRPALEDAGITIVRWDELSDDERDRLGGMFTDRLFPVLTPLAVDPAHPFPYISGLSLNLAVVLVNPRTGKEHFARVKVPPVLPRLLRVEPGPDESPLADMYDTRFVPLEDVISAHLDHLFPGMEVREHFTFRVTRNEDLEVEEDDAENLLTALERELTRRRFGPPVRLEVEQDMDDHVLDLLVRELGRRLLRGLPAAGTARPARAQRHRRPRALRPALRAVRRAHQPRPGTRPRAPRPATSSRRSASRTSCCSTPTTRSRPRCRPSSSRPRPTPGCSPSSRRSTAPAVTPRSSTPSSTPPRRASRCSRSSRSRRASTSRTTSRGPASSSTRACTSSTASSG